ncbi:MAG: hypothetical protein NC033_05690 [Clostridiales bacterium]|nr:hypothetical protein [Clostridiales bacterium]
MAQGYRREFLERLGSGEELGESEILNIILGNAYGGKDMSAVSAALLERFPGVSAILNASFAELISVDGVTESVAAYLKTLDRVRNTFKSEELFIIDTAQCFKVAEGRLRGAENENLELYFVNKGGKVTKIKRYTSHLPDKVEVAAGELLSEISSSGAYGLYIAHNHINTAATPSKADNEVTAKLLTACGICKIAFFDHCIVGSGGEKFSYRESGLLQKLKGKI